MAKGRRDYTWGFQNETGSGSRSTESFVKYGYASVPYAEHTYLYTYKVPEGKRLAINRVIFSSDSWDTHHGYIYIGSTLYIHVKFSITETVVFSDQNPFYITAGQTLKISVVSNDELTYMFYVNIIGVLETL